MACTLHSRDALLMLRPLHEVKTIDVPQTLFLEALIPDTSIHSVATNGNENDKLGIDEPSNATGMGSCGLLEKFTVGDEVLIHDLTSGYGKLLNGQTGKIVKLCTETGRAGVRLDNGHKVKAIKPRNLSIRPVYPEAVLSVPCPAAPALGRKWLREPLSLGTQLATPNTPCNVRAASVVNETSDDIPEDEDVPEFCHNQVFYIIDMAIANFAAEAGRKAPGRGITTDTFAGVDLNMKQALPVDEKLGRDVPMFSRRQITQLLELISEKCLDALL